MGMEMAAAQTMYLRALARSFVCLSPRVAPSHVGLHKFAATEEQAIEAKYAIDNVQGLALIP